MSDLDDAIAAAWDDLSDAELDHDQAHATRATAELRRLEQLLPAQRPAID
jgi:hypothetical protein